MSKLRIYSISDEYINYLRRDRQLSQVSDPKENARKHTRKYLGVVMEHRGLHYYIPLSSPKETDYIKLNDGTKQIRKSILPIIRITALNNKSGKVELRGTLKICNMIPVPDTELIPYSITAEKDECYRQILKKEYTFITKNSRMIRKYAEQLYKQQTCRDELFIGKAAPKYLDSTIDFLYAEQKCKEFMRLREKTQQPAIRKSVKDRLTEAQNLVEKSGNYSKTHYEKIK